MKKKLVTFAVTLVIKYVEKLAAEIKDGLDKEDFLTALKKLKDEYL